MNNRILSKLKPWMVKPFELLFHAEIHFQKGTDYDKRLSFISFDNSIEVSITTYLNLHPSQRGNRKYKKDDIEKWLNNYHSKIDFFILELEKRGLPVHKGKDEIVWFHEQRNNQYHDSSLSTPDTNELNTIRQIAIWVFSVLFDISISNVESLLREAIDILEKTFPEIPEDLVKPKIESINVSHENSLFIASLLGGWDENSQGDNEIIREFTNEKENWLNDIREIKKYNDEILSLKNGKWRVVDKFTILLHYSSFFFDSHLDLIKAVAINVLSTTQSMFDLEPEKRFASEIYGKKPIYSDKLRKGIAETLAFLGVYGSKLKNCTLHKAEQIAAVTIKELLEKADWKLWASLNDLLPILAEAAPDIFLLAVEEALKKNPCPFDELFKQEGAGGVFGSNYMTGLYWALETLAWSEKYLSKSLFILAELAKHDPGGHYANRPLNSIITILLPWLPQTTASIDIRIGSIKGIQRCFPDIAWKIIIHLLPRQKQVSMGSHKPLFKDFIPKEWKKEVTINEYWEQVKKYTKIAIEMAKGNITYISELAKNLDNIPQPYLQEFLNYLSSEEMINLPDEQKQPVWESLIEFIGKHSRFSDADWALPAEIVNLMQQTADKIKPSNPLYLYRHLFSNQYFDFYDYKLDWKTKQENILKKRIEAIKTIYEINKIDSIINFSESVENPRDVGNAFAHIADKKDDNKLLPDLLNSNEQYKQQFISGYIWSRYNLLELKWIDNLNPNSWPIEQKCELLYNLPFENEIWEKAKDLLGNFVDEYWKNINVNPFPTNSNLLPAIENFLKNGRPFAAINCIYAHYFSKKEFFKEKAIEALIAGITSDEHIYSIDQYQLTEIIKILQDDPQVNKNDLIKIEFAYLYLLQDYAKPKTLEKYLLEDPNFFVEIIQLVYRGKNQPKDQESDIKKQKIALNAWNLLNEWKLPPGKLDDGSFSVEGLTNWYNEVKMKTIESGHYEKAMQHIGQVLFYTDPEPDGLWIHKSVAELLDEKDNNELRRGFSLEVFNSHGVHFVDPSGNEKKKLADLWRSRTAEIEKLGLIHFAKTLKDIADSYDHEAERVVSDFLEEFGDNIERGNNE